MSIGWLASRLCARSASRSANSAPLHQAFKRQKGRQINALSDHSLRTDASTLMLTAVAIGATDPDTLGQSGLGPKTVAMAP